MRKALVAGAVLALALIGSPWAQQVTQRLVSGNECWNAGQGPGGPSQFLCINQVRNGSAIQIVSGAGAVTTTATVDTGTLYWKGTAPTTWGVTFPTAPFEGQIIRLSTDTTLTTMVTITAGTGTTLNAAYASQTLTLNTTAAWQHSATVWYRLQ